MEYKTQKTLSTAFGFLSAIGTIATAIFAVKCTPKALTKHEQLKEKHNGKVPKKVLLKEMIPIYWPALVIGLGTISSTTLSHVLSRKAEASLIATSALLSQGWNKYKYKIEDLLGPKGKEIIRSQIAQDSYETTKPDKKKEKYPGKKLYYEEHLGWFYADPVELTAGISDINQRLYAPEPGKNGSFYFATLYLLARDSRANVLDKTKLEACKTIGWTADYIYDVYNKKFIWVHPTYSKVFKRETGELLYTHISFWENPIFLYDREVDRDNYKSRIEFEHLAESDINFQDDVSFDENDLSLDKEAIEMHFKGNRQAIDEYLQQKEAEWRNLHNIYLKEDCDQINDDLDRMISSNPNIIENSCNLDENGDSIDGVGGSKDLPPIESMPTDD